MKFTLRVWHFNQWLKIYGRSNEFKKGSSLFKAGILSIVFGAIVSFIVIGINGINPLAFFGKTFELAFNTKGDIMYDYTWTYFAIYVLGGLAVAVGFKTGIFNIGVSGQMLLAGSMVVTLGIMQKDPNGGMYINSGGALAAAFFIAVACGAALSSLAGVLKAFFHIHEVVSSIMLNWAVWYFTKWLFTANDKLYDSGVSGSAMPDASFSLMTGGHAYIIPIVLACVVVIIVYILMKYTTLGFKLRGVGYSPEASRYAGVNIKANIIGATAISGAIAGILGFVYYLTISQQIQYSSDALPTEGFDSIAITLVAFNNPIGVIPVSFIWGIIKVGAVPASQAPGLKMSKDMAALVFGVIIYGAAISSLFLRIKPVLWCKKYICYIKNTKFKAKMQEFKKNMAGERAKIRGINAEYKVELKKFKAEQNAFYANAADKKTSAVMYVKARREFDYKFKDLKAIHIGNIKNAKLARRFFKDELWEQSFGIGRKGIITKYFTDFYGMTGFMLDAVVNLNSYYVTEKQTANNRYRYRIDHEALLKEFKNNCNRIKRNNAMATNAKIKALREEYELKIKNEGNAQPAVVEQLKANLKMEIQKIKESDHRMVTEQIEDLRTKYIAEKNSLSDKWLKTMDRKAYRNKIKSLKADINSQFSTIKDQTVGEYAKYKKRRDDALMELKRKEVQ